MLYPYGQFIYHKTSHRICLILTEKYASLREDDFLLALVLSSKNVDIEGKIRIPYTSLSFEKRQEVNYFLMKNKKRPNRPFDAIRKELSAIVRSDTHLFPSIFNPMYQNTVPINDINELQLYLDDKRHHDISESARKAILDLFICLNQSFSSLPTASPF